MSDWLEGLAQLLNDKGVALFNPEGAPSSIFIDFMPERAEHSISLNCYGGDGAWASTGILTPRVQARARGDKNSPRWSRERIQVIYTVLHGWSGVLPTGHRVPVCYGLQSAPLALGPDAGGRYEHSLNFSLWVCPVPNEVHSHAST